MPLESPPLTTNPDGKPRRVGVEIEFAGINAKDTALLIQTLYAGTLERLDAHRFKVADSCFGDFGIELDTQYAHPDGTRPDTSALLHPDMEERTRELLGDVVSGLVPTEVVCPPVPWEALSRMDDLIHGLHQAGAKGTDASLLYGFGLHLNPEIAATNVNYLRDMLRAYLLLAGWLREQIKVDITREVLPHANPFPKEYARQVLAPDYAPDLDTLVDDYLIANPTRNRELDMLPVFAYLCPTHPHALLGDTLTKPRPTFHYRLPNAQLSESAWGAVMEWNRWVEVERLAADSDRLASWSLEYLQDLERPLLSRWRDRLQHWWQ